MIVTMRDDDAAELLAILKAEGQAAFDTLRFDFRQGHAIMRMGEREWRVAAEPTPERAGALIVRTASGRTIVGDYPDDLSL